MLRHVYGCIGLVGNHKADALAKRGASMAVQHVLPRKQAEQWRQIEG